MIEQFEKYGLKFRTVDATDAEFIIELRSDPALSKFLSPTKPDLNQQKNWIEKYKEREARNEEAYFISIGDNGERLGLNRLYHYEEDSFTVGSWLYKRGLEMSIPILGDFAAREYGFEALGFSYCKFDVRKANQQVLKYHLGFKPERLYETELDYFFKLSYNNYRMQRDKLLKILNYGSK
jgi:RimJ/RimL family protein N-acetyltransferase